MANDVKPKKTNKKKTSKVVKPCSRKFMTSVWGRSAKRFGNPFYQV